MESLRHVPLHVLRVFLAVCLLAAMLTAVHLVVLSDISSAAAQPTPGLGGDRRGGGQTRGWDTDNLDFVLVGGGRARAGSFGIPIFSYSGSGACAAGAPGFFQTPAAEGDVNDFPVADLDDGRVWFNPASVCQSFAGGQETAKAQMAGNGGVYLAYDEAAGGFVIAQRAVPGWYLGREAALVYDDWDDRWQPQPASFQSGYEDWGYVPAGHSYAHRLDAGYGSGVEPEIAHVNEAGETVRGRVGLALSISLGRLVEGGGGSHFAVLASSYRPDSNPHYLPSDASAGLCPPGFHPRGEDAGYVLQPATGRTLSSLNSQSVVRSADRFWCRSDGRYERRFTPAAGRAGTSFAVNAQVGGIANVSVPTGPFDAWGRMNCYHTAFGVVFDSSGVPVCDYPFPLPVDCADLTAEELAGLVGRVLEDGDGCMVGACAADVCEPGDENGGDDDDDGDGDDDSDIPTDPVPPGWDEDPCVVFAYAVGENRPAGFRASPGIAAAGRYVQSGDGWDLASVGSHRSTASPPREATDPGGCADGPEGRADHTATSRGEDPLPAGLPVMSAVSDSTAPPGGLGDFSGVREVLSHLHASLAAERDCAAARSEADTVRALVVVEMSRYLRDLNALAGWADMLVAALEAHSVGTAGSGFLGGLGDLNRGLTETYRVRRRDAAAAVAAAARTQAGVFETAMNNLPAVSVLPEAGCLAAYDTVAETIAQQALAARSAAEAALAGSLDLFYMLSPPQLRTTTAGYSEGAIVAGPVSPAQGFTITARTVRGCPDGQTLGSFLGSDPDRYCFMDGSLVGLSQQMTVTSYSGACVWTQTATAPVTETSSYTDTVGVARQASRSGTRQLTRTVSAVVDPDTGCPARPVFGDWSGPVLWGPWSPELGSEGTVSLVPAASPRPALHDYTALTSSSHNPEGLLGGYHPADPSRADLTAPDPADRQPPDTLELPALDVVLPSPADTTGPAADLDVSAAWAAYTIAADGWRNQYQTAYSTAQTQALADMGGDAPAVWSNTSWEYNPDSLIWTGYQGDGLCDSTTATALLEVPDSGALAVAADRLDFETRLVGTTTLAADASCKIRRQRRPALKIAYQRTPAGTDTSYTPDDWRSEHTPSSSVQPQGDHQLTLEHEIIQLNLSLSDTVPRLCHSPYPQTTTGHTQARLATAGGAGLRTLQAAFAHTTLTWSQARPHSTWTTPPPGASRGVGFFGHCGDPPLAGSQLGFTWFDDTAHSRMSAVWMARALPPAAGVSDTEPMRVGQFVVSQTYADTGAGFYGDIWAPAANSQGWTATGNPNLDLTTRLEYGLFASDKPITSITSAPTWVNNGWKGYPPTASVTAGANISWHPITFTYVDCLPDIKNAAFIDTVTAFEPGNNQWQGFSWDDIDYQQAQPGGTDEHRNYDVRGWYHPPLSLYEGLTLQTAQDPSDPPSEGTPETMTLPPTGEIPHPHYGSGHNWYLRTDPFRNREEFGQWVVVIRYDTGDRQRDLPEECGDATPQTVAPQRYNSNKLGTPLTSGPGQADQNSPLIVWSEHSSWYAANTDAPVWEPRWYFADQQLDYPGFGQAGTLASYEIPDSQQSQPDPATAPAVGDTIWLHGERAQVETVNVNTEGHAVRINGRPVVRLEDHEMTLANIVVYDRSDWVEPIGIRQQIYNCDRYDLVPFDQACPDWLETADPKPADSQCPVFTTTQCRPVIDCSQPGWYCLAAQQRGWGIDEFDWLAHRDLRIGFQHRLPRWQANVSTLDHTNPTERGALLIPAQRQITLRSEGGYTSRQ